MKLNDVARYDRAVVRGDAKVTQEGFIRANAVVTRTGVFNYKNADGTIRRELRHPDEVFKESSLETMKMIPITNGHPQERLVSAENSKKLAVGFTGETIENDGEYVLSRLVVTDVDAVKDIVEKNRKELSLGYTVDLIAEDGTWNGQAYEFRQTNIKYNHLSLVDMARAGSEARIALDSADAVEIINEESNMAKVKIRIDQEDIMVEEKTADHYERLMEDFRNLSDEKDRVEAELAMISEKLAKLESKRAERDESDKKNYLPEDDRPGSVDYESKMDGKIFNSKVRERVKLEKLAESVLDGVDVEDLSNIEIKKRIIRSKNTLINLDGKSSVYVDAAFDIAVQDIKQKATVKAIPRGYINRDMEDVPSADESRKRMISRMSNPKFGGR